MPPRLERIPGAGVAFIHECERCGAVLAAFGEGVALNKGRPGVWYCRPCWQAKSAKGTGNEQS